MNIKVSDRVKEQQPLFIQEENEIFYSLLQEYYKSQEKVGRSYSIVNDLNHYLDVNTYGGFSLADSTILLSDVGYQDKTVFVQDVTGFQETDGSFMIDKEVFYYETITKSPNVVLTPGISSQEFDSRYQVLESLLSYLVPTGTPPAMRNTYPLRVAGQPVSPIDSEHLIVSLYGKVLKPGVDYNIDGTNIVFTQTPRQRTSVDGEGGTYIKYLLGFAQNAVESLDEITCVQGRRKYPLTLNSAAYIPRSEILSVVTLDKVLLNPYEDYVFTSDHQILLTFNPSPSAKLFVRNIEYTAKEVGSGARVISKVNNGQLSDIIVLDGGSGYSINYIPKVTVDAVNGKDATAVALIDGVKSFNLLYGGTGYTSQNPPLVTFDDPPENGTRLRH